MREILFRGKTVSGRWAEGSLILAGNYCCILEDESKIHPSDYPYLDSDLGTFDGQATPVDPETVGQFTGMLDKNGKKIFEGDIFKYADRTVYTVYWSKDRLGFYAFENDTGRKDMDGNYLGNFYGSRCEVIGDIYEPTFTFKK